MQTWKRPPHCASQSRQHASDARTAPERPGYPDGRVKTSVGEGGGGGGQYRGSPAAAAVAANANATNARESAFIGFLSSWGSLDRHNRPRASRGTPGDPDREGGSDQDRRG